jgi:hypothetical protein
VTNLHPRPVNKIATPLSPLIPKSEVQKAVYCVWRICCCGFLLKLKDVRGLWVVRRALGRGAETWTTQSTCLLQVYTSITACKWSVCHLILHPAQFQMQLNWLHPHAVQLCTQHRWRGWQWHRHSQLQRTPSRGSYSGIFISSLFHPVISKKSH